MDNRNEQLKGIFEEAVLRVTANEIEDESVDALKDNLEYFNSEDYATVVGNTKGSVERNFANMSDDVARELFNVFKDQIDYEYIVDEMVKQQENRIKELEGEESNDTN